MNAPDIRVSIMLRRHRKRRRLEKLIGPGSVGYLLDLWIATAVSRPDGILSGWTPQDIAEEVDWQGDPEQLLAALKDSGWIERMDDGTVVVHDWTIHQGWAAGSNARSNRARLKALIRHHGEENAFRLAREKYGFEPTDFMPQHKSADAPAMLQHDSAHTPALPQHATAMQQQCSGNAAAMLQHESASAPALHLHDSAHAGADAPYPSPSPLPSLKDSTNVLSGAKSSAGSSKKTHFSKSAGEYAEAIKGCCLRVEKKCNGSKRFNPYQWAQHWVNKAGHPQAVVDSLEGLVQFWDQILGEPWAYADKIMKTKSGNYHERDEATKGAGYKKMLSELVHLLGGAPEVGSTAGPSRTL